MYDNYNTSPHMLISSNMFTHQPGIIPAAAASTDHYYHCYILITFQSLYTVSQKNQTATNNMA